MAFLPQAIDNDYRGYRTALWVFGLVVFVKVMMSVNIVYNPYRVATNADGIPLATFAPVAVQAVTSLFSIWAVQQFAICVLCVVALVRYRSMVPLLFALLIFEHVTRKAVLQIYPIMRVGNPPGFIVNLLLLSAMAIGLVLSLMRRRAIA